MSTSYDINYNDQRFKTVESEKSAALSEAEKTYDSMISESDKYYQDQINATTEWEKKQTELQNEQTDFAIQEIEQQKEEAKADYIDEQSGAYTDWQKQSDKYGVRAEQIADKGMQNTGYSESSQVSMYNTYQNRVATARESYDRAVTDYNNSITQARLSNNSALAEIANEALTKRLELSLSGFQYKNDLIIDKSDKLLEIEDSYYNRYQDVLEQMNTENELAEEIRQFDESLAEDKRQFDIENSSSDDYSYSYSSYSGGYDDGGSYSYTPTKDDDDDDTGSDSGKVLSASDYIAQNRNTSQTNLLDSAISKGASKKDIASAISHAEVNGTITSSEAETLRDKYTRNGNQW